MIDVTPVLEVKLWQMLEEGLGEEQANIKRFKTFQFEPVKYTETFLGWKPWSKQVEIMEAYSLALRQLEEKFRWEEGQVQKEDLEYWEPGQVIQNWISVDAGFNVGKTKLAAGLVSHFFDCFSPSITYCFAPSDDQINYLLFKEIRVDRNHKDLPGTVMQVAAIKYKGNHFVKGKATNNSKGTGAERIQGQHGQNLMFILDEAEGISEYVWEGVRSMASGGNVIVIILRNPRTTTCEAHRIRRLPNVALFTISQLEHPNVVLGKNVIPGAVRREYIIEMVKDCDPVEEHDPSEYTFEIPWHSNYIYRPTLEMLWRVFGVASEKYSDNVFTTFGAYDAAINRGLQERFKPIGTKLRFGIDIARFGADKGTVFQKRGGWIWRSGQFSQDDSFGYYTHIKQEIKDAVKDGVTDVHIRIDGGGGFASGVVDLFQHDAELQFRDRGDFKTVAVFEVFEVSFNGIPYEPEKFYDSITEMHYHCGLAMSETNIYRAPQALRTDLCERPFKWAYYRGHEVRWVEGKDVIKTKYGRSTDDGDGYVLVAGPDHIYSRYLSGSIFF